MKYKIILFHLNVDTCGCITHYVTWHMMKHTGVTTPTLNIAQVYKGKKTFTTEKNGWYYIKCWLMSMHLCMVEVLAKF